MTDLERLHRLLGGPVLADLRARLRKRYEQGRESGSVTLGRLSDAERAALCGLLGRVSAGASLRFDIGDLDAVLSGSGAAPSLRAALELLDGPIENRVAQREAEALGWSDFHAALTDSRLAAWLAQPRALGALKRACGSDPVRAAQICVAAGAVLAALPCQSTTRSHLAARILGDAHALDSGRAVATLVLAALRHARVDALEHGDEDESARAQWAAAGVLVNELARPALFLNLPGGDSDPGEPAYLSLRALLRNRRRWDVAQRHVFVCENPNIVALAADALGTRCAPLVCTDGMPAAAQRTLLTQLVADGAHLHYHGDFDWPGIAIGNTVMTEFGAEPWRFGTRDYRMAIETSVSSGRRLDPHGRDADWDSELKTAMLASNIAVDEEAVAVTLLDDLDAG